jgi:hypothetical protein
MLRRISGGRVKPVEVPPLIDLSQYFDGTAEVENGIVKCADEGITFFCRSAYHFPWFGPPPPPSLSPLTLTYYHRNVGTFGHEHRKKVGWLVFNVLIFILGL